MTTISNEQKEAVLVAEAKSSSERLQWKKAMESEMKSLHLNRVWELVELPSNQNVVGSKWVFKWKVDANGSVG